MEQYAPRIDWSIKNNPSQLNGAIFVGNQEGCGLIGEVISGVAHCASAMLELKRLIAQPSTKVVTIAMSWLSYDRPLATPEGQQELTEFLQSITKSKRAHIILNMPAGDELSPANMVTGSRLGTLLVKPLSDVTFDLARFEANMRGSTAYSLRSGTTAERRLSTLLPLFAQIGRVPHSTIMASRSISMLRKTRSYARRAASYIDRNFDRLTPISEWSDRPVEISRLRVTGRAPW